jgi:tRNA U55 pseudouridine synthase TruB
MPLRRSLVHSLELVSAAGGEVRLDLYVSSGTYVRSLAVALGGHCRTLRRTAIGPFAIEEADAGRMLSAAEALARLPAEALDRVPIRVREAVLALEAEPA